MKVEEGEGWRLVVDASRAPFPVLVGGEQWAAEFTVVEGLALAKGIGRLVDQHHALADRLMAEETIELELELLLEAHSDPCSTPVSYTHLTLPTNREV